jgi:uncharacterized protein (DUF1800 family)
MSSFLTRVCRKSLVGGALAACLLAGVVAQAAPNAADVSFPTNRTVLWLGHTQVIVLHLKAPAESDASFTPSVDDPRLVDIVRAPVFLAGEQSAYLRVRALHTGQTRLEIRGGPALDVEVKPDPAEAANVSIDQESRRPQIVSPMPGAVVWGEFGVGVTLFDDSPPAPADGASPAGAGAVKVQLRLPNGHLLDPINATAAAYGPERQYQFSVPAGELPAGPTPLVALAANGGSKPVESAPLSVQVKPPQAENLWAGECESPAVLGATKHLYAPARPARFGTEQPNVGKDPDASGLEFVSSIGRGWCLPFIVKTAGNYQMIVRARAEFAGGAYPSVALYVNNTEEPAGLVRLPGSKYERVPIGTPIHLDAGPQVLTVQFKNGFGAAHENRNLFLDTYELAQVDEGASAADPAQPGAVTQAKSPAQPPPSGLHNPGPAVPVPALTAASTPELNILYPANGAGLFGADAVVVQVSGGTAHVDTADLLIDGRLQDVALRNPAGNEPMVFPLVLRGLEPGDHRLAVRATVASGQTVDSPARLLKVLPQAPAARGPYERAVWLLDRLAFGPEPKELAAILTQGESKWLATRLIGSFNTPAEEKVLESSCRRYPHIDSGDQTAARALSQWIETDNPVRARFTAWAENHFSTWMTKTKPAPKWDEHVAFCRLGIAPFSDLLEASAHSAAMLVYLDQEKSYAGKINENYAREIMELHTLGVHGGYKQADVTEMAEVLNGWTTAEQAELPEPNPALRLVSDDHTNTAGLSRSFRFVPALNDGKPRRVLGLDFAAADPAARYDRIQLALEMLAAHPSTADHVCRKLAEHYVGVPAPDALVHHLATVFLESGGDLRVVMFALAGDPAFWTAPPKVATPFDYSMRAVRLCRAAALQAGAPQNQFIRPEAIDRFLKRSGMGLFDRVTPDGYPENSDAYADSNALLQRWRFMQSQTQALNQLVPAAWRTPPPPVDDDELNHLDSPQVDSRQRLIDLAALRLTGRLLSPGSNQAALEVAAQGRPEDLEQALVFVSLLPETSLR